MKSAKLSCALLLAALAGVAAAGEEPGSNAAASATPPPGAPAGAHAASSAAPSAAASTRAGPEASIPFANHGGIWTWQVENDHSVLIQSSQRKWYRATLLAPCFDLPFAERVGFETNADGSFDRFGSLTVRGQRCPLTSLVPADPPARKGKKVEFGPKPTPPAITHGAPPRTGEANAPSAAAPEASPR